MTDLMVAGLQIAAGLLALVAGGELLLRGATALAALLRISPLVIGLTVVAFGTSAPELAVSVQAAWSGNADLALGNVVGSNIFNVLFILGASALIVPLTVGRQLIQRDVPVMVLVSGLLLALGLDGTIDRANGAILSGGLVGYVVWTLWQSRREKQAARDLEASGPRPPPTSPRALLVSGAQILIGLVLLAAGSRWLVGGSIAVAEMLGVSELIIGLTIVAVGTSLPEVVTSVLAAVRGQRDIAVGNVVGSNIFNILAVLGLSSLISPNGIAVAETALRFDIPVMIAVAVACLPIFFTGHLISRGEGGLLLFYYGIYTTYLVLDAMQSGFRRTLADGMLWFVIPLTVVTLLIACVRVTAHSSRSETPR